MKTHPVLLLVVVGIGLSFGADAVGAELKPSRVTDAAKLLQRLIPLPKEISVKEEVVLPAADVRLVLPSGAGVVEQHAARKLRDLFLTRSGTDATEGKAFEILMGVCGKDGRLGDVSVPDAARLAELPNREQAYLIRPMGASRLVLTALDERGLFYAALTLRQLIESGFRGSEVSIPLAVVTDWPDLAERGEWGTSSVRDIEWLADRKMNLVEFHTTHQVKKDGTVETSIDASLLRRGKLNAMTMVPIISHLNGMNRRGVFDAYPDLKGQGERATYKGIEGTLTVPCASHPKLHEIMADWMRGYARHGVRNICCWLSELRQWCQCERCSAVGQFALETRAFVKAWRIAQKEYPDLRIRILTTQGSYESNDKVLAEIPPDVGVTYYDGRRTYDSSKEPMIYPLLEQYAAQGRWLGVYPQLTASWRIVSPWSCPQFIKCRMTEFVDKKLACLGGYVVPDNLLYDFNVTAAAEWSWNAHGRDERQFALAWATRQGFAHPEMVADWAVSLGQASWDLYGARLVERYFFRPQSVPGMLYGKRKLTFGLGIFAYIPDQEHFQRNLSVCKNALQAARQVGSAAMVAESETILSYYQMVEAMYNMTPILADRKAIDAARRVELQKQMNLLALAGMLNAQALCDWERTVRVGAGSGRFLEGVQATIDSVQAIVQYLEPLGIRNPAPCIGRHKIGEWQSEDFQEAASITKTFDITKLVAGPGKYEVTFLYTGGWNGLSIERVALAAQANAADSQPVEVGVDQHTGSTAVRSTANVYSVELKEYLPEMRYWIVAKVRGTKPQSQQPGRTGCSGTVFMQRQRDLDWQQQIMATQAGEPAKVEPKKSR